jgi:transcriptional regulator with XRE-family HTH domain
MDKKSKFAERLKELRKERGMSQMDLALATRISQSAIAKWELDKTEPTASALITLSKYFGESVDFLLGLTD